MAEKKPYTSIIDAILDEREPDWKGLDLKDAKVSGEDLMKRTHQYVDSTFEDDIAESASRHTKVPPSKSASQTYEDRMNDKEAASPRLNAVQADWHKDSNDFKSTYGDSDSLVAEVTMSIEKAESGSNFKENSVSQKEWTDAQAQNYVKQLLNQGVSPSKVAAKLKKLAEIELFNHQSATDYLQRNAGLMGLAYLEPNTYMDKSSPTYERTASKTAGGGDDYGPICPKCDKAIMEPKYACPNCGYKQASALDTGKTADVAGETDADRNKRLEEQRQKDARELSRRASSNECVRQHEAFKQAGIKIQARSVKQITACADCSFFKKDASGKACNLYHLPVVANTRELSQIVNNLTPGVPEKRKHAALVQIANREDQHVQPVVASTQTNIIKTADARVKNQQKRTASMFSDERETKMTFSDEHVAKMHDKGASLEQIYKWASGKFGDVDTSLAFRGFVQNFKKDAKGKIVVASADLTFLRSIGIRNEAYQGAEKCASCPTHFNRVAREADEDRGAQRVEARYTERTPDALRSGRKEATVTVVNAEVVRKLHQVGHSIEKIYNGAASKVGSVQAKKAVTDFVNDQKKTPSKFAVSESDRAFLVGKLGFKPESVRMLDPLRRPTNQVVASVPDEQHIMAYPGMDKQAGEKVAKDGHAILAEYDLASPVEQQDIDTSGPQRDDIEISPTFRMDD